DLGNEGILTAAKSWLQRTRGGKIGRSGKTRQVSVSRAVHCDAVAKFTAAAPEVSGEKQRGAGRIQLCHKGSTPKCPKSRLQRTRGRKISRIGFTRQVGVSRAVHRNGVASVIEAAPEVGGVNERGSGRI